MKRMNQMKSFDNVKKTTIMKMKKIRKRKYMGLMVKMTAKILWILNNWTEINSLMQLDAERCRKMQKDAARF